MLRCEVPIRQFDSRRDRVKNRLALKTQLSNSSYNGYHRTYCLDSVGEVISRENEFGSNFSSVREFEVFYNRQRIGTIQSIPSIGEIIQLAGESWEVVSIDSKYSRILVKDSTKITETFWKSGGSDIQTRLMRSMYECLTSDENYSYLDERATSILDSTRRSFREYGLDGILVQYDGALHLFPWLGTVQFDTLFRILEKADVANVCQLPYSMIIKEGTTLERINNILLSYQEPSQLESLVSEEELRHTSVLGKYSRYIPLELLKKQFIKDRLDADFVLR